jgi:probable metal-binding protein
MPAIHGHEVMNMMIESQKTYTKEALISDITEKFGTEARFYACSADDMTAAELVQFLENKGKFMPTSEGFKTDSSKVCQH